ncbi:MAG: flagellar motor switch protein FliG [Rhodobacterales bacterium RIFCSPHIGHO2_02_FULL_62_130]|jgi:flagellar motor switch protein FliG|nr:MAG: flagellar motor switch protein FliG [Rhodobacterales bacterium RIFCSPHIGHO2_02_FULL_62_130]OHC55965.1 MAG: flagellar motor switch protein FliG [Rhodobacterales bacterium RIFCSPHIGHO2_12_FULL_62_75]HCY99936.1 flagellar motor switch protein FliG [Rhodobacter sp.]
MALAPKLAPATPPAPTSTEKAAILMMLFGERAAAGVLKNLSPSEVQHLGSAMYAVRNIEQALVDAIVEEFLSDLSTETGLGHGASGYIRVMMTEALGEDKAQSVISRINPASTERPIEILDWMDARSIAELIGDEHPQIVALVVACLEYNLAADVLSLLAEDLQTDVVRRIAELNTVQPEALRDLEQVLQRKFKASTSSRASQIGGVRAAARIMNFTRQTTEQRILRDIRKDDRNLMQQIQDNMFVFDNLVKSDDRSLQTLLRNVESELLVLALKGADEVLREKLLGCMSTRAAANIRDEMEALGPVRLTDVQEAQKQIITVARRLSDEGTIVLAGRGGEQMV